MSRFLTPDQLAHAAAAAGVDPVTFQAVMQVEAKSCGFLPCGRPVILFERHILYRRLKALHLDADHLMRQYPHLVNTSPGDYQGGSGEHFRLKLARQLHDSAALESTSWGLFQIMGFHWKRLGYTGIQDFADRMSESEAAQLQAFSRFLKVNPGMLLALREKNWAEFARRYNGPCYHRNRYDKKLQNAFETLSKRKKP